MSHLVTTTWEKYPEGMRVYLCQFILEKKKKKSWILLRIVLSQMMLFSYLKWLFLIIYIVSRRKKKREYLIADVSNYKYNFNSCQKHRRTYLMLKLTKLITSVFIIHMTFWMTGFCTQKYIFLIETRYLLSTKCFLLSIFIQKYFTGS